MDVNCEGREGLKNVVERKEGWKADNTCGGGGSEGRKEGIRVIEGCVREEINDKWGKGRVKRGSIRKKRDEK